MNDVFDIALRATVLLAVALVGWYALRSRSAQARSLWLRAAVMGLVSLPLWMMAGPEFRFEVPWVEKPSPIVLSSIEGLPIVTPEAGFNWSWVWALVAGLLAIRMTLGGVALARMWSQAFHADDDLSDELYQALARLEVSRPVDFRLARVGSPMTFGIRRACVVVPEDFETWPARHREAALMHEAAHIRRFDCGWQWLATSVRALLWCHPLVWWLAHAIRDEAELAADERVIAAGIEATDYATALVEIARTKSRAQVPVAGTAFMREGQLSRRVTSALQSRRGGFTPVGSLGLMAAAIGAVVAVSGLQPQLPRADVLIVSGKPTPVVLNAPPDLEVLPVEIDDHVVPIDAGLDPLPTLKARPLSTPKVAVKSTQELTVTTTAKVAETLPATVEATVVTSVSTLRSSESEVLVVVAEPAALAPKNSLEGRRVLVYAMSEAPPEPAPASKSKGKVFAYHSVNGKEFIVDIPPVPTIPATPSSYGAWTAAERAEFKRSMETLERDLKHMYFDGKARKSMEEALRIAELDQLAEIAARSRSLALPPAPAQHLID